MLFGEYQHNIDVKGRINFPAKFRNELGESFIVAAGVDQKCLFVYALSEWNALHQNLISQNQGEIKKRLQMQRFLYSSATDAQPDKQGRVIIPAKLRDYAQLEKEVVVIGAGNHAEIWSRSLWDEIQSNYTEDDRLSTLDGLSF